MAVSCCASLQTDVYNALEKVSWIEPGLTVDGSMEVRYCRGSGFMPTISESLYVPTVRAIAPDGRLLRLKADDAEPVRFRPVRGKPVTGLYRFYSESSGCCCFDDEGRCMNGSFREHPEAVSATRCFQYAEALFPFGRAAEPMPVPYSYPLRLAADHLCGYRRGNRLRLYLFFGYEPLPLFDVTIFHRSTAGAVSAETLITDGDGCLDYRFPAAGDYLFVVRHTTIESAPGRYFDTNYSFTLRLSVLP